MISLTLRVLVVDLASLVLVVLLASCAPVQTKLPTTVQVQVDHYIAVPSELTKACPIETAQTPTVGEVVRVAHARLVALRTCNDQLNQIRSLGTPNVSAGSK